MGGVATSNSCVQILGEGGEELRQCGGRIPGSSVRGVEAAQVPVGDAICCGRRPQAAVTTL